MTNEKPKSAQVLNQKFLQLAARHPHISQKLLRKSFLTMVVTQMLPENTALKGGASLALRYPLEEARSSRDIDTLFSESREQFLSEFQNNLSKGWEGFTGLVEAEERKRTPQGVELVTLIVKLDYKGKRFASIQFEATPDAEGHIPHAAKGMAKENMELMNQTGFDFTPPRIVSIEDQLADKLNALSDPDKRRGKDLRDIQLIMRHHTPDLDKLREAVRKTERVPYGHEVHVMDTDMDEYRESYQTATGNDFEGAWELANDLLEQVDCDYPERWKDHWEDSEPSTDRSRMLEQARLQSEKTREYFRKEEQASAARRMASPIGQHGGRIQVAPYQRADGKWVRGYTRRR